MRLRLALRDQIARPASDGLAGAGPVVREAARAARAVGMPAEQLVILLKRTWSELPEPEGAVDSSAHQRIREQLVTRAIKAYYAEEHVG